MKMEEGIIICPGCGAEIDADDYFEEYAGCSSDYDYKFKVVCYECNAEIEVKRNIHVSYELVKESLTDD